MPGRRPKIHQLLSRRFGHVWMWDPRQHAWTSNDEGRHYVYRNKNSSLASFVLVGPGNVDLRRFDLEWLQQRGKVDDIRT